MGVSFIRKILSFYFIFCYLVVSKFFPLKKQKKVIGLVKIGGIGDYVLFRNYLKNIKLNNNFKGHKIVLCLNKSSSEMALKLDKKWIDDLFFIDSRKFQLNPIYLLRSLIQFRRFNFSKIINLDYSRDFSGDFLTIVSGAKLKICFEGDCTNLSKTEKHFSNRYYSKIFKNSVQELFEFDRNKEIFSKIFNKKIKAVLKLPKIKISKEEIPKQYVVISVGGSSENKRWPIEKYIELAEYIFEKWGLLSIFIGGNDIKFESNKKFILNKVGKLSILESIEFVQNSKLVITNDTCTLHFAGASNIPAVCITNNLDKQRFISYPKNVLIIFKNNLSKIKVKDVFENVKKLIS
jgi:ADP-heptose:LPS heptosyltransferase